MSERERWLGAARDWVHAVERAYVAAAFGTAADGGSDGAAAQLASLASPEGPAELAALAAAAAGAVASRFLAVGTPRSIGLVGDPAACELSLHAHRVWFQPADIRWAGAAAPAASPPPGAPGAPSASARAAELAWRTVSLDEALAADIVCIHAPLSLEAARLRRGTHVNALAAVALDDELRALATIVDEPAGLPALAAGLRDGRQLDELTVFVAGDLAIARRALAPVLAALR
jgi:hypothetical protein